MGTDACIFAKKAKAFYYFDRFFNLMCFVSDEPYEQITHRKLSEANPATAEEVKYVCRKNIEYWGEAGSQNSYKAEWNKRIIDFVNEFPNDEYFVVTDNEDPSCWDYDGRYARWHGEE